MSLDKRTKKILVVDDDPVHVKLLASTLKDRGYEPLISLDAAEGLQTAMDKIPDLIVLDVMMPIINGYNFCKMIKSDKKCQQVPIIFITSRGEKQDFRFGHEMGADAYMTKPVDTKRLLLKIDELLRQDN